MENKKKEFCIYIHWPFCLTKCPYCDFNTHIKKNIDEKEWLEPYLISLDYWKSKYPNASIVGHRDITDSDKTCPNFDVKRWIETTKKNENRN